MPASNRLMAVVMALVSTAALSAVEPPSPIEQEGLTAEMIAGQSTQLVPSNNVISGQSA